MSTELKEAVVEYLEDIIFAIDNEMRIKILRTLLRADEPLSYEMLLNKVNITMEDEAEMTSHLFELIRLGYVRNTRTIPVLYFVSSLTINIVALYDEFKKRQ